MSSIPFPNQKHGGCSSLSTLTRIRVERTAKTRLDFIVTFETKSLHCRLCLRRNRNGECLADELFHSPTQVHGSCGPSIFTETMSFACRFRQRKLPRHLIATQSFLFRFVSELFSGGRHAMRRSGESQYQSASFFLRER